MHINGKKIAYKTFCLLIFAFFCGRIFAEEQTITLGGINGWSNLQKTENIEIGLGRYGYDSLMIATNSHPLEKTTDLLIDFEDSVPVDISGHYSVSENNVNLSKSAKMGQQAGLTRGSGGLRLSGKNNSLFGTSGVVGSFTIEFWLNPSIAETGEIVFSWRSSRTEDDYPLYQMISASFYNNHLRWEFTNVFNGYSENGGEVSVSSFSTIIPGVWTHHSISFNEDTGLLEYRINGHLEDMRYVTSTESQKGGSVYSAVLGVTADIEICPQFTGLIDDFRIQREVQDFTASDLHYETYKTEGGRVETAPILISHGATLNSLDAILTVPNQTDISLYVRSGDNYFEWTDESPEWILVNNHQQISGVTGLYFQVAADLYTDGAGDKSPSITEIKLNYTELPSPLPPFTIIAEAGNSSVTLTWSNSVDDQVGGYYVFYGERPGEYLGQIAVQGDSPIDVGIDTKITLTGLRNGKIYYFAVAAYSKKDKRVMGNLSNEVYARPLRK
mgnify:CR=1 FL=1